MSMITPEEIRYSAISFVALAILTRVLNFMYDDVEKYEITEYSIPTIGDYKITQQGYWANLDLSDIPAVLPDILEAVTLAFSPVANAFSGWLALVDMAGWASVFILVPSVIMLMVIANTGYKLIKALPTT